jgi:hypothetical protein
MWGIDTEYIKAHFGLKYLEHYTRNARPFLDSGDMKKNGSRNYLSENGMYISDFILKNLFLERDPMII